jgi:hypothetical protein
MAPLRASGTNQRQYRQNSTPQFRPSAKMRTHSQSAVVPTNDYPLWPALVLGSVSVAIALALVEHSLLCAYVAATILVVGSALRYPIVLVIIFALMVPLIPKLPMVPIPGYFVPIRFEDFFLAFALAVILIRLIWARTTMPRHPLAMWMFIFFIVQGLSLAFAVAFHDTIPDVQAAILYWLRTLEYFSASLLCLFLVRSWRQFQAVLAAFAASVFLVGVYGALQELSLVPAFNTMHMSGQIVAIYYFTGFESDRLISTFGGAYDLAGFYVIAVPILMAWLLLSRSRLVRTILLAVIALSVFCLYLTFARAPLFGLAVALLITLWLLGRRQLAATLAFILPLSAFVVPGFRQRLDSLVDNPLGYNNLGGRLAEGWNSALLNFFRSPVFGTGPTSLWNGMGVDNLYLLLLGSFGVVGLVAFIFLARKTIRTELRAFEGSPNTMLKLLAVGLLGGTVGLLVTGITQDTFFSSKNAEPFWFLFGLLLAGMSLEAQPGCWPASARHQRDLQPNKPKLSRGVGGLNCAPDASPITP